jgi:electron transfer flavoprotein alpha subunit
MKIFVIALQKEGRLVPASLETVQAAKSLGGEVTTVILSGDDQAAQALAAATGGKVVSVVNDALKFFNEEVYTKAITELIGKQSPEIVLGPATQYGKALFGRLAAVNGGCMASDATGLAVESGKLAVIRPSYGGNVVATVVPAENTPFFVTVRPKIFAPVSDGAGELVSETVAASCFEAGTKVKEVIAGSGGAKTLAEADVIVSAGRGIKGPENMKLVEELANSLNAAVGASRAIVDADWVPYAMQVGQTGRTVNPKLYVALGISGAIQHLVGMQTSKTIVAVNKDKDAPIFNIATYGIVGDLFEVVPALTKKFEAELK